MEADYGSLLQGELTVLTNHYSLIVIPYLLYEKVRRTLFHLPVFYVWRKVSCKMAENVVVDAKSSIKDGKNGSSIVCQRCGSVILRPNLAVFTQKEMFLPSMRKKSDASGGDNDGETLIEFWVVDNMYTFENIGFSNTVGTMKYLICADCEIGPVGWHDITDKTAFYVALDRVEHRD
jgi:hypothetical protein